VTAFLVHNLAPIMFICMIVLLLLGYPVAFALAANGLLFGFVGILLGQFPFAFLQALPENVLGLMQNESLLAIPFFTFMGLILERSGMAEDLLDTVGQLFGPVRGGLAYAVILVGALLAATTGVVAASVIAMGLISLPIMLRYGYDRRVASGVIAASGTLAQIIPPSLVLIIMAGQLGVDLGKMYTGAFIPGLILTGLYMLYVFILTLIFPNAAPALPVEARTLGKGVLSFIICALLSTALGYAFMELLAYLATANGWDKVVTSISVPGKFKIWWTATAIVMAYIFAVLNRELKLGLLSKLAQQVIIVLMPPLALVFLVLGTIFLSIATPTEGGAMGALGALLLAMAKRRLDFSLLRQALEATTKLSAFVMFILVGAAVFRVVFYGLSGQNWVEELLLSIPGGELGFLIVVNIIVFVLAFFLDFFELAFIMVPLLMPVAKQLGIDLVWFGVLLSVNLQTSFMHPPFGFALFYLRSVAPHLPYIDKVTGKETEPVTTAQIYWGAVPFVIIQIVMVGLTIAFPGMVTHYKSAEIDVKDPSKVQIILPPPNNASGAPNFGASPNFGTAPNQGPVTPSTTPPLDLSQPPKFN
jgi:TRAP-type mannitol/chloroaromatic compound transport system permease large subunit